jgi:hypothetical protein
LTPGSLLEKWIVVTQALIMILLAFLDILKKIAAGQGVNTRDANACMDEVRQRSSQFGALLKEHPLASLVQRSLTASAAAARASLDKAELSLTDFAHLISPAATLVTTSSAVGARTFCLPCLSSKCAIVGP